MRLLGGPFDVYEIYVGGKRNSIPNHVCNELAGRGPNVRTVIVGVKDRETNRVAEMALDFTDKEMLQRFVEDYSDPKCYFNERSEKHNVRVADTLDLIDLTMPMMTGKRLRYRDLKEANGLDSGVRAIST